MAGTTSHDRYSNFAILMHWSSALAVVLAFTAGFVVANVAAPAQQVPILIAHIILGSLVLLLTLLRIVWWMVAEKHPAPLANQPGWQRLAAKTVHIALYAALLLLASSGITTLLLSGAIPTILGGGPLPDFSTVLPRLVHGALSKLLLALFVIHVAAALWHQFVRRDHLLARMGIGKTA